MIITSTTFSPSVYCIQNFQLKTPSWSSHLCRKPITRHSYLNDSWAYQQTHPKQNSFPFFIPKPTLGIGRPVNGSFLYSVAHIGNLGSSSLIFPPEQSPDTSPHPLALESTSFSPPARLPHQLISHLSLAWGQLRLRSSLPCLPSSGI